MVVVGIMVGDARQLRRLLQGQALDLKEPAAGPYLESECIRSGEAASLAGWGDAAGDLNCPYHLVVWQNLGMPRSQQADASIFCGSNYSRWVVLFR